MFPDGCTIQLDGEHQHAQSSTGALGGLLGSAGGLVSAATSGNLGSALKSMLKSKAIDLTKQAATGLLMKLFTIPAAPKPPKPPWLGLGKVAAPGSDVATSAISAYKAAHNGPVISSGAACGGSGNGAAGSGASGGGAPGVGGGSGAQPGSQSPYPYDPRGAPAQFTEWARYLLGLENDDEREALLDHMGLSEHEYYEQLGLTPNNYLDYSPLEEPWYADFLGGSMENGYTALFGLILLGSPKWPGAGTHGSWWVPDELFGYDMSPYYVLHDRRFDSSRDLGGLDEILGTELVAYGTGLAHAKDPIHVGLQTLYSSATLLAGLYYGVSNTLFPPPTDEQLAMDALREPFRRRNDERG